MATILDVVPQLKDIIETFVPTPEAKANAEAKFRELDIREIEARTGVQKARLSNDSLFVAGAIPAILWTVVLVVVFNNILSPLLQLISGRTMTPLDLPLWYTQLAGTIVVSLFAKKAWDGSEFQCGSLITKTSKDTVLARTEAMKKSASEMTSEEIDARIKQLAADKGIS